MAVEDVGYSRLIAARRLPATRLSQVARIDSAVKGRRLIRQGDVDVL
ncbi:MAG: hypothetical protein HY778_00245 [Betaproteobacteria bacterium]|nr:hypothetical protein [Betaproteobacteria bacterium]